MVSSGSALAYVRTVGINQAIQALFKSRPWKQSKETCFQPFLLWCMLLYLWSRNASSAVKAISFLVFQYSLTQSPAWEMWGFVCIFLMTFTLLLPEWKSLDYPSEFVPQGHVPASFPSKQQQVCCTAASLPPYSTRPRHRAVSFPRPGGAGLSQLERSWGACAGAGGAVRGTEWPRGAGKCCRAPCPAAPSGSGRKVSFLDPFSWIMMELLNTSSSSINPVRDISLWRKAWFLLPSN